MFINAALNMTQSLKKVLSQVFLIFNPYADPN
ncbi:hypothetical protein RD1_1940 [Roseobacter denitrificans OCh 114]|uniref:Uncharacterized protein n=1 Tax=Roseobacter denitrificans (strain ATCC 33942 / OCh 114) TaxID=375451 RepID=Q168P5_ROSDO|nr:hypothetical protein RD1_1940 [Roseobacter denitrificans OCh 114]